MSNHQVFIVLHLLTVVLGLPLQYFDINLDLPPKQRWKEVVHVYRDIMIASAIAYNTKTAGKPQTDPSVVEAFLSNGHWDQFPDLVEEMEGMVEEVNHPMVTVDILKLQALDYEMGSPTLSCSSVFLAQPNGTVLHGRNMDYSWSYQIDNKTYDLRDETFEATFYKDKKPLFILTGWPGDVGVATGMRFGGWAFDQQTREGLLTWQHSLANAKQGGLPGMLVVRKALETIPDFKTAMDKLYNTPYMSPQYFSMSGTGPYEGCVLTIDGLKHEQGTPPIECVSAENWYLVQTNEDLDKASTINGFLDPRRPWANWALGQEKRTLEIENPDWLMQFMHTEFLFDALTSFSTVMVPKTGYYKTTLPGYPPAKNPSYWRIYLVLFCVVYGFVPVLCCCGLSYLSYLAVKKGRAKYAKTNGPCGEPFLEELRAAA